MLQRTRPALDAARHKPPFRLRIRPLLIKRFRFGEVLIARARLHAALPGKSWFVAHSRARGQRENGKIGGRRRAPDRPKRHRFDSLVFPGGSGFVLLRMAR